MEKGQKITHKVSNVGYVVESIMHLDSYPNFVIFTNDGKCFPINEVEVQEEKKESFVSNPINNRDLELRFFGCLYDESVSRKALLDKKINEGLFKTKIYFFFKYALYVYIDDTSKYPESYHTHVNSRSAIVLRLKNVTYSFSFRKRESK